MADRTNYLIGRGERLTSRVEVAGGGSSKSSPYGFSQAVQRLSPQVVSAAMDLDALPEAACPDGEAVAIVTMHPRYVSKSDFPERLLRSVGLRPIGSKSRNVKPERWGVTKHPETALTTDLFVAGPRAAFRAWSTEMPRWLADTRYDQLTRLEAVQAHRAVDRMRSIPRGVEEILLEVVLHTGGTNHVLDAFMAFADEVDARPDRERIRVLRGLAFLPVRAHVSMVDALAEFAFMRVARSMPGMRPLGPVLRSAPGFQVELPTEAPVDPELRIAVFDGGVPDDVNLPWVRSFDATGVGNALRQGVEHGLAVTSAALFGPLTAGERPARPYAGVDHHRVLGDDLDLGRDPDMFDVLDRILETIESSAYEFVNISIGPDMAVEDDDVSLWTSTLDVLFANGTVLATAAVGNRGDLDHASGLNRIQPPSDGVNVLAVGASDSRGDAWERSSYSCRGPGRVPGIVKPDLVAFGGSLPSEPFYTLHRSGLAGAHQGTSFAAPSVARAAAGVRAHLGPDIGPLAIRALLVHRAERQERDAGLVGWGLAGREVGDLITGDDHEIHVVYQGTLPAGQYLRCPVPLPDRGLQGMVTIAATVCIASEVDPEHSSAYTRAGMEVRFRPHSDRFDIDKETGQRRTYPKTRSFFQRGSMYPAEYALRADGSKWEPILSDSTHMRGTGLHEPCFDIRSHQREAGQADSSAPELPYALVVTVSAPQVTDLYDAVVRAYNAVLQPLVPRVSIPVTLHNS